MMGRREKLDGDGRDCTSHSARRALAKRAGRWAAIKRRMNKAARRIMAWDDDDEY